MIRKLLLLLVVISYLQNTSYSQQASVLANCYYQSASSRIVIRLAIRNNTASGQDFELSGIRIGVQYNAAAVTPAGYTSYMYEGGVNTTSLNASDLITCIGADTDGGGYTGTSLTSYPTPAENQRTANIKTGGTKVLQRRYFTRSSEICANSWGVPPNTYRIMVDFYFTLNDPSKLSYYNLNTPGYGFDSPDFIAQSMESHNDELNTSKNEIGIVLIRNAGCSTNPYQPFSWTTENCVNGKVNPITIDGDTTVKFISPINGVLAGKAVNATVADKTSHVQVQWSSENNQLIDYFEVQRKDNNGEFKTIGLVMGSDNSAEEKYEYKDKVTVRDIESSYRIKVIGKDKITTYSNVQKIRLGSSQVLTIKVYPNPSSDAVRITLPEPTGIYVSRIYSTEGRMVLTGNVSASNPSVNIKSLQVGSYFMELYHPKTGMRYYTQFNKQ